MEVTPSRLQVRMETVLTATLLLTPVWWILGCGSFIYQLMVFWVFAELLAAQAQTHQVFKIPMPLVWLGFFLLSYLTSVVLNLSNYPFQRILSSLNHFLIFTMSFLIVLTVIHLDFTRISAGFFKTCWILSAFTGTLALLFLILWSLGYRNLEFPSLLGHFFPSLMDYPYFYLFSLVRLTGSDWLFTELPRLSIYSNVQTATGGFLIMILPLGLAHSRLRQENRWGRMGISFLTLTALFLSLSRMAICAFLAASVFVWFLERRNKIMVSLILLGLVFFLSSWIYDGLVWLLNLRPNSTVGRLNVYSDALKTFTENNPLIGVGVRPRNEFTLMAVGSHSTYVGLLLMTGITGFCLFILFQGTTFVAWFRQRLHLVTEADRIAWRYLGISYIGATIWFLTDTLDTLPFIAYVYFLIAGCILSLNRFLERQSGLG